MNKRQRKKIIRKSEERFKYFQNNRIIMGRSNGKTVIFTALYKMAFSKKYRPFKRFMRYTEKLKKESIRQSEQRIKRVYGQTVSAKAIFFDEFHTKKVVNHGR